jgi:thiamine transporter ThiT
MALYTTIFITFSFTPYLGYISFGPISITTLKLVTLVIIFIHKEFKFALFSGLAFGITSLVTAVAMPRGVFDPYFVNPLISVMPRVVFALVA